MGGLVLFDLYVCVGRERGEEGEERGREEKEREGKRESTTLNVYLLAINNDKQ